MPCSKILVNILKSYSTLGIRSLKQIAEDLDVTLCTLYNWINGTTTLRNNNLQKVLNYFNFTLKDLENIYISKTSLDVYEVLLNIDSLKQKFNLVKSDGLASIDLFLLIVFRIHAILLKNNIKVNLNLTSDCEATFTLDYLALSSYKIFVTICDDDILFSFTNDLNMISNSVTTASINHLITTLKSVLK